MYAHNDTNILSHKYEKKTEWNRELDVVCSSAEKKGGSYVCKLAVCALHTSYISTLPHPHTVRSSSIACEKWVASAVQNSVRCETPKQMVVFNIFMLNYSSILWWWKDWTTQKFLFFKKTKISKEKKFKVKINQVIHESDLPKGTNKSSHSIFKKKNQ